MQIKKINPNKAQLRLILWISRIYSATSFWSRGTGKSFFIAWLIKTIVETMPRSSWAIVGQSYKQLLTRTLPSTLSALEYFGYKKDVDFFIKRRPPAKFKFGTPYEGPLDYEHYMIFRNGTGFHLVSLDPGGGSSRGLNIDGYICDEAILINREKLGTDVTATNRGKDDIFKNVPYHHGAFYFSSMAFGDQGKWLLEHGNYYNEYGHYKDNGINLREKRREIVDLQLKFVDNKDKNYRLEIWKEIMKLKEELKFFPTKGKRKILYTEADIFDNLTNVGIRYLEQQRRELTDFLFLVEILNWLPESIEGGFYPALNISTHTYRDAFNNSYLTGMEFGDKRLKTIDSRMDGDCVRNQPLRIAVDWGGKINCMTVCQYFKSINTLKYLKNLYVKTPKILDDLANDFVDYYKYHGDKTVYFAYDHTGNTDTANTKVTYAEQFAKILRDAGWTVIMVTKGAAPSHQIKYLLWNLILKKAKPNFPEIQFNLDNCSETFFSMQNAPVKEVNGKIEKEKKSERSSMPQEEATHLSDTADIQLTSLFSDLIEPRSSFVDVVMG